MSPQISATDAPVTGVDCCDNYFRFEPEAIAKFNDSFKVEFTDGYFSYEDSECSSSVATSPTNTAIATTDIQSFIDPWVSCFKFTDQSSVPLPKFDTISPQQQQQNFDHHQIIDNFDTTYLDLNVDSATLPPPPPQMADGEVKIVKIELEDVDEFQCRWAGCEVNFKSQKTLVAHIEKCHVEGKKGEEYTCFWRECVRRQKPFNARYKLLIHMRVHSGEKPNKCPVSEKN